MARSEVTCEPLMRILDHLPPIKMLSRSLVHVSVMPRWHCPETRGALRRVLRFQIDTQISIIDNSTPIARDAAL